MCVGNETNLLDCARGAEIYASNCEHREDAGVRCQGIYVIQLDSILYFTNCVVTRTFVMYLLPCCSYTRKS